MIQARQKCAIKKSIGNHLGIISNNTVSLSGVASNVNFKDASNQITYGSNAQTTQGMQANIVAMWAGDGNNDAIVRFSGSNSDANNIKDTILNAPGNILSLITYSYAGYFVQDTNMNGGARFSGTAADTSGIKDNILAHPGNILNLINYSVVQQIP